MVQPDIIVPPRGVMMSAKTVDSPTAIESSGRVFARAVRNATSDAKGVATLLGALLGAIAAFYALVEGLKAPLPVASAILALYFLVFYFLYVHPEWRDERKRHRLDVEGVKGHVSDP